MKDSGHPAVSGTNTLTIVIGDINDNEHYAGHKDIYVYSYRGECHLLLCTCSRFKDKFGFPSKRFSNCSLWRLVV